MRSIWEIAQGSGIGRRGQILMGVVAMAAVLASAGPWWIDSERASAQMTPDSVILVDNDAFYTDDQADVAIPLRTVGNTPDDYDETGTPSSTVDIAGRQVAQDFTTGPNVEGYTITEVSAFLSVRGSFNSVNASAPLLTLHAEDTNNRGYPDTTTTLATFDISSLNPTESGDTNTFSLATPYVAEPNTRYFLLFSDGGTDPTAVRFYLVELANGHEHEQDDKEEDWSIGDAFAFKDGSAADWQQPDASTDRFPVKITVTGYAGGKVGGNLANNLEGGDSPAQLYPFNLVGNQPDINDATVVLNGDRQVAVPFTTGTESGGYTIDEVQGSLLTTATTYMPVVTLHADSNGNPVEAALATFTNPSPLTIGDTEATFTFTSTDGVHVEPSTTYHLKFSNSNPDTLAGAFYSVRAATNPTETTAAGWQIGTAQSRIGDTGTWAADSQSRGIRIGVNGYANAPDGLVLSQGRVTVDEEDSDGTAYQARLASEPSQNVTVTPTAPTGASVSPTSLTFTDSDWYEWQTFTVTAPADDDLADTAGLEITHAITGYGDVTSGDPMTVDVRDNDEPGVTITPTTLTVNEGASDTYSLVLTGQPSSSVTVTPTVTGNTDVTINPSSLTFTTGDWGTAQMVTVSAAEDTNSTNETATITHAAAQTGGEFDGIDVDSVAITVNDNDIITLSVSTLTVTEGMSGTYTVNLGRNPTSNVTVNLALSADIGVTIDTDSMMPGDQTTLTFTDMNGTTPQTVTVTAPQDDDGFDNIGTVTHTVNGGGLVGSATLSTTVDDDETVGIVVAGQATHNTTDSVYELSVNEGASNTFTVALASQPFPTTESVTFSMTAPANSGITFKKTGQSTGEAELELTFTGSDWNTAQTVTVEAAQDPDSADAEHTIGITLAGANYQLLPVDSMKLTIADDDSPGLVFSRTSIAVTELDANATATYTVRLATRPNQDQNVTVTLTQPTNGDITVAPATLTFSQAQWGNPQTVTVTVAADDDAGDESGTITHSVSQSGSSPEYNSTAVPDVNVTVNVDDDETPSITGATAALAMTEPASGTAASSFTLRLNPVPTSDVTITMAVAAVTPAVISGQAWTNADITTTSTVTLTPSNFSAGETVTVTLSTDTDAENDVARIDYTVSQAGGSMEYDGYSIASTTVNITDPETATVEFRDKASIDANDWSTAYEFVMQEPETGQGGNIEILARLTHQPRGQVTVKLSEPLPLEFDPFGSVTFSVNGWSPSTVQEFRDLSVRPDDDSFSQVYTLTATVTGYGGGTVSNQTVKVADADPVTAHVDTVPDDPNDTATQGDQTELEIEEPNSGTYTLRLNSRPSTHTGAAATVRVAITSNNTDVTVNPTTAVLNSGNWETGVTVTVRAAADADGVDDAATLTHTASSQVTQGGDTNNGDYHAVPIADVTVEVTDDDELGLVYDSSVTNNAFTIAEKVDDTAATKTMKIKLATEPTDSVTLTITDPTDNTEVTNAPDTLTFTSANWNNFQDVTVTAVADNDTVDDTATITFTASQTGASMEYDALTISDVTVTVTDPDKAIPVITRPPGDQTVIEGESGRYGVRLSHVPKANEDITVTLAVTGTPAATKPTLESWSEFLSGGSATTRLSNAGVITFTSANATDEVVIRVTSKEDANLSTDRYTITHTAAGVDANTTAVTKVINVTDDDTPNLGIGTAPAPDEGGTATYTINLLQQPATDVTVAIASSDTGALKFGACTGTPTDTTSLTFTNSNYAANQTVTVCGVEDHDAADETLELRYTVTQPGTVTGEYHNLSVPVTSVTVDDDEEETITISPTRLSFTEGDGVAVTGAFTVTLSAAPTGGNVTVTVASNNDDVTVGSPTITFSASDWTGVNVDTPTVQKTMTVSVADDADAVRDTAELSFTQGGVAYGTGTIADSVNVTVTDSDTRGITINADSPFIFDEGGSKTYTIVLDTEPTGTVTVEILEGTPGGEIRLDRTALTFTADNWDTPQTVTVISEVDADAINDTDRFAHQATGGDYSTGGGTIGRRLDVTVNDLDVAGVEIDTDPDTAGLQLALTVGEGLTATYEVELGTQPFGGDVTVTPTVTGNPDVSVAPASLTFTATDWNESQTVTVTAEQEDGDTAQDTATITHAVSGADYGSVTAPSVALTINDDDSPSFSTSVDPLVVTEGTTGAYTVVLDTIPVGGDVTITITAGGSPDIKLLDSEGDPQTSIELEFTGTDWNTAQTVQVQVAEDRDALVESGTLRHVSTGANFDDAPSITMRVNIIETTLAGVTIDPTSLTITEGRTATYGVTLQSQPQSNVTISISSDNSSKVRIAPTRLTFTNSTWDVTQDVTVTGVSDPDNTNESATISHVSSGDIYTPDVVMIDDVTVKVIENGASEVLRDTSSFLRSSSCDGEVRLTWNAPTADDVTIESYIIQWRSGKQQYSTSRQVTATADATSHTLGSLTNGTTYTIRVQGLDDMSEPVWSRETTAIPSDASCINEVRYGNILADSAPVIVDVAEAEAGTQVNLRHRSLNPGVWSDVQTKEVQEGQSMVVFDVRGLRPDSEYEIQTWLGDRDPPMEDPPATTAPRNVAQRIFRTTALPEGFTFSGGGGGGPVARIARIEPGIRSVTLSAGDVVELSVDVWGRQGIQDPDLADRAPGDGRPIIRWSSSGDGAFAESGIRREWRDGVANDRSVTFIAASEPGTVTVTASLVDSAECLAQQEDESSQEHEARCTATIEVTVVRRATAPIIKAAPVNPPGPIPQTLTDEAGVAYAVLTPVEGGSFVGDGYSLVAGAGAVANGEYVGVAVADAGDASNIGQIHHRYTLAGSRFAVLAVDAGGESVADYLLGEPATVCLPMPDQLRADIGDLAMLATVEGGTLQVLTTKVRITPDGVVVCGAVSQIPVTLAVGARGAPDPVPTEASGPDGAEEFPDTGGAAPGGDALLLLLVIGASIAVIAIARFRHLRKHPDPSFRRRRPDS